MAGFSADWLRLREPADHAARNETVRDIVVQYLNQSDGAVIADLASGTGSTVRALADSIEVDQHWHLIDNDESLLQEAEKLTSALELDNITVQTHKVDLKRFPSGLTAISPNMITVSAFVDLSSLDWLSRLVTYALMERIPVYTALTYSGTITLTPEDPKDARFVDAFNQHQQTDKGFGEALGPFAADRITKLFKVARFRTVERDSSWHLGPDQAELQKMVLKGWVQAVIETQLIDPEEGDSWLERRLELIERGELQITISHKDVAAFPK